jgi:hypothetical protein
MYLVKSEAAREEWTPSSAKSQKCSEITNTNCLSNGERIFENGGVWFYFGLRKLLLLYFKVKGH